MRLITTPIDFKKTFLNLLNGYQEYYFATAWAGVPDILHNYLLLNLDKIKKFAVGIHFYQTDPRFFESHIESTTVRAVLQPTGTFHPKLFLFYNNDNDWSLLVGSGNFTNAAFTKNSEAIVLIESKESSLHMLKDAFNVVNGSWKSGKIIDEKFLESYKLKWDKARRARHELEEPISTNDILIKGAANFMTLSWNEYVIQFKGKRNVVNRRVQMLESIRSLFASGHSLNNMSKDERRLILGNNPKGLNLPGSDRYADFGTSGNGDFMHFMLEGDDAISDALDCIPLVGTVHYEAYEAFINSFMRVPYATDGWVSSAARLLAMKRPDVFYNITNANRAGFCSHFDNVQTHTKSLENYWRLVVEKIGLSRWYNSQPPSNNTFERKLWDARAAMLDVLYYKHANN